jgi:hypothetical protein
MFDGPRRFFSETISKPIQRHSAMALFFLGIILIGLATVDSPYITSEYVDALSRMGGAILGAGVFAVIMKSAQFSELFQQHIADVIYDPKRVENAEMLPEKWRVITSAILAGVLPSTYDKATQAIEKRFFDDELDYHFENFEVWYDISVGADNLATVSNTLKATLVISPKKDKPVFQQKIMSSGSSKLSCLMINDKNIDLSDPTIFEDIKGGKNLTLDLGQYISGNKSVKFERTFITHQDIANEPFVTATITRFIKGAVVRAKVTPSHRIRFLCMGIEAYDEPEDENPSAEKAAQGIIGKDGVAKKERRSVKRPSQKVGSGSKIGTGVDGRGYRRWMLAQPSDLLLPGQGYTLIIVPNFKP